MDNRSPNPIQRDDCLHLMTHALEMVEKTERYNLWVLLAAVIVALASVAMNLGVLNVTQISAGQFGDFKLTAGSAFALRLFLTCTSLAAALVLIYVNSKQQQYALMIDFLAIEKKYDRAQIMCEYYGWFTKRNDSSWLSVSGGLIIFVTLGLLVVMPVATFGLSLFRS